jgi:hypothetical protein
LLAVLIVMDLLIKPVLWSLWEPPPEWVKVLTTLAVVGPIGLMIRGLRRRAARSLEIADETANAPAGGGRSAPGSVRTTAAPSPGTPGWDTG